VTTRQLGAAREAQLGRRTLFPAGPKPEPSPLDYDLRLISLWRDVQICCFCLRAPRHRRKPPSARDACCLARVPKGARLTTARAHLVLTRPSDDVQRGRHKNQRITTVREHHGPRVGVGTKGGRPVDKPSQECSLDVRSRPGSSLPRQQIPHQPFAQRGSQSQSGTAQGRSISAALLAPPVSAARGRRQRGRARAHVRRRPGRCDVRAFAERCEGDQHHFRFIVSPDDAIELTDLCAFTRDLRDLGTKLEWTAVPHWNTEHPHIHFIVRGKGDDGRDLVISRDYISHGLRARAEHLVTLELGPRSELEIRRGLEAQVDADRWTKLDRSLAMEAARNDQVVDLRLSADGAGKGHLQACMIGRMRKLERLGLTEPLGPARWRFSERAEPTLRALESVTISSSAFTEASPSSGSSAVLAISYSTTGIHARSLGVTSHTASMTS
jgi:hypothetical protein